jgi:hypothetical protein
VRLRNYSNSSDLLRLAFEIIYLILFFYNMIVFLRTLLERSRTYNRWWKSEIQSLTPLERDFRSKKRPEWLRKLNAIIDAYTVIDIVYFALSITAIVLWVSFN